MPWLPECATSSSGHSWGRWPLAQAAVCTNRDGGRSNLSAPQAESSPKRQGPFQSMPSSLWHGLRPCARHVCLDGHLAGSPQPALGYALSGQAAGKCPKTTLRLRLVFYPILPSKQAQGSPQHSNNKCEDLNNLELKTY